MLAERAPLWKQEYIQQGITAGHEKGLSEGLAIALQDYLEARFGDLSQDIRSRIGMNSDPKSLRELTRSAYRAESLERFAEELKKVVQ